MRLFFITLLILILNACGTTAVQIAEDKDVIEIREGTDSIPLAFNKIIVKLRRLEKIGDMSGGIACVPQGIPIEWQGGRINITDNELTEIFRDELLKANYPIVGDPNALFDDPEMSKAELLVAGMITKMEMNACYPMMGFGDYSQVKGGVYIKVDWQIYSTLDRSVIYKTSTEGSHELSNAIRDGAFMMFSTAFANATRNLLGDVGFYNIVVRPSDFAEVQNFKAINAGISNIGQFSSSISSANDRLSAALATVRTAIGHGSGFFIGDKGYFITNQHVVKDAKYVKLLLSTGREMIGEVIRTDKARDLALIVTPEPRIGLPLNYNIPDVGEEVFAIGSPLSEEFSLTVTRGILSSVRTVDKGFEVIQSDVNVSPGSSGGPLTDINGNVIGVTVSGVGTGSQGINFFIPSADLPKYLGLLSQRSLIKKADPIVAVDTISDEESNLTQIDPEARRRALEEDIRREAERRRLEFEEEIAAEKERKKAEEQRKAEEERDRLEQQKKDSARNDPNSDSKINETSGQRIKKLEEEINRLKLEALENELDSLKKKQNEKNQEEKTSINDYKPPRVIKSVPPEYSSNLQERGMEGDVVVTFYISELGKAVNIRVSQSSGIIELDDSAKESVILTEYDPATINSLPVLSKKLKRTFSFNLKD